MGGGRWNRTAASGSGLVRDTYVGAGCPACMSARMRRASRGVCCSASVEQTISMAVTIRTDCTTACVESNASSAANAYFVTARAIVFKSLTDGLAVQGGEAAVTSRRRRAILTSGKKEPPHSDVWRSAGQPARSLTIRKNSASPPAKHHPSVPNVKLRAASTQEIPPTPLKTKHFREIGFVCSKRHRHITEAAAPATKPPTVPLKADR